MFTVALVGADGAGKTTIGRALPAALPFPAIYLYMGVSLEASSIMLPTTRLILALRRLRGASTGPTAPPVHGALRRDRHGPLRRGASVARRTLRLAYLMLEESFRFAVSAYHLRRGRVVIFDRHFFVDFYSSDVRVARNQPMLRRLHGVVLARFPRPDLVICLDAPAEVLWQRKPEGRIEWIEQRRAEYLRLAEVAPQFAVIDASRPLPLVMDDVRDAIVERYEAAIR